MGGNGQGGDRQSHGGTRVRCGDRKKLPSLAGGNKLPRMGKDTILGKFNSSVTFIISELNTRHLLGENLQKERARDVETQALAVARLLE